MIEHLCPFVVGDGYVAGPSDLRLADERREVFCAMLRDKVSDDTPDGGGSAGSSERRRAVEDFAVDGVDVLDADLRRRDGAAELDELPRRPLRVCAATARVEEAVDCCRDSDTARRDVFGRCTAFWACSYASACSATSNDLRFRLPARSRQSA